MAIRKGPVCVVWEDAAGYDRWDTEHPDIAIIHTFGIIVSKDKKRIVVAGSLDTSNQNLSNQTAIPSKGVKKIIPLKFPQGRK